MENYQLFVFPVIILGLVLILPKVKSKLVLGCFLAWLPVYFGAFPARFLDLGKSNIIVSQLENDSNGLLQREWYRELKKQNVISSSINEKFETNAEVLSWLSRRLSTSFLVTGDSTWLRVVFPEHSKFAEFIVSKIKTLTLDPEDSQLLLFNEDNNNFTIALAPIDLSLAREPNELSAGLLAEMSEALSQTTNDTIEHELQQREQAAMRARRIFGYWKSGVPRSWAFYTEATLELISYVNKPDSKANLCDTIISKYTTAAKLASSKNSPPNIAAYIYSNAGVANIICKQDYQKAKNHFDKALFTAIDPRSKRVVENNIQSLRNF